MAVKTERILGYLPATFQPRPGPSALYAFVDAFGSELLRAENSLAALMAAHWVDHADRNAGIIDDLQRMSALYGLAPRPDENVEEFREHLKRYIRTFLEGTVTVQGILRVVADVLNLHILDDYRDLDTWWKREGQDLKEKIIAGSDATEAVFGIRSLSVSGNGQLAAELTGKIDLAGGVDLRDKPLLRIKLEDHDPVDVDLIAGASDPARVSLNEIITQINTATAAEIASRKGDFLHLQSTVSGPGSSIEILDTDLDAASKLLGLLPRRYHGQDARPAQVRGSVDLSGGIDLSEYRFIRLLVDGSLQAEVDCAGADPASTTADEIKTAINTALGLELADHDGHFLTLTSPTTGAAGSILFLQPAAQDATATIFGPVATVYTGNDPLAASVTGQIDLIAGIDLSSHSKIQLSVNDGPETVIDCAGADPGRTRLDEIVAAINNAFGRPLASHDLRHVIITSDTTGLLSTIQFGYPPQDDATAGIFGLLPRKYQGRPASSAVIQGRPDLSGGLNVWARNILNIAVDGRAPAPVRLRKWSGNPANMTPAELVAAVNGSVGQDIATHDGRHLILKSQTTGTASRLSLLPEEQTVLRKFTSRAFISDEAALSVFGFLSARARGTEATSARLEGNQDLSRGVDLSENSWLNLALDGQEALDINCAGARPRATQLAEIVDNINTALGNPVATTDGRVLILQSQIKGPGSRLSFASPRPFDAGPVLLGPAPAVRFGQPASSVHFKGLVDLSAGIRLDPDSAIKLTVDDTGPVEIVFAAGATEGETYSLSRLVLTINQAMGSNVAAHDGRYLSLNSLTEGQQARIEFYTPAAHDVTMALFGITGPRSYHGTEARPARLPGTTDLTGKVDLSQRKYLNLSLDESGFHAVDCSARAADPAAVTLTEIIDSINDAFPQAVAFQQGGHLVLQSIDQGGSARIEYKIYASGNAVHTLFGFEPASISGLASGPAIINGQVDLSGPVDLSQRSLIRLMADGRRPVDIDIAGSSPAKTYADEIVEAVNRVFPGMASLTAANHLRLTARSTGSDSTLALLPLRSIDLVEYPPLRMDREYAGLGHADTFVTDNHGAAQVAAEIELSATSGIVGPQIINLTDGRRLRVRRIIPAGSRLHIKNDASGHLQCMLETALNGMEKIHPADLIAGPVGRQVVVPFEGAYRLSRSADYADRLQLNNPHEKRIVHLIARSDLPPDCTVEIEVRKAEVPAALPSGPFPVGGLVQLTGSLSVADTQFLLLDADDQIVAKLQDGTESGLASHLDQPVLVFAEVLQVDPLVLSVRDLSRLFDVKLHCLADGDISREEVYQGVTIGREQEGPDGLSWNINFGPSRSSITRARGFNKSDVLSLSPGRSRWQFMHCLDTRFNAARFNESLFNGGRCREYGVFDISTFAGENEKGTLALFGQVSQAAQPLVHLKFNWQKYQAGAFRIDLPADLPERFGARFNRSYFSGRSDQPESYEGLVTEPPDDPDYLVRQINDRSLLVSARVADEVPIGFAAHLLPFRKAQFFTGGSAAREARFYLIEDDVPGVIELKARRPGSWGNMIAIASRPAGPARFDVTISYQGGRFEMARKLVRGTELAELSADQARPGPVGILQGKAAGIRASVSRRNRD